MNCFHRDDEKVCHRIERPIFLSSYDICNGKYELIRSDLEQFLCDRFFGVDGKKAIHFSLDKTTREQTITLQMVRKRNLSFS